VPSDNIQQVPDGAVANADSKSGKVATVAIDITFVTDSEIQELNIQYRSKPKPTDVLSFALTEGKAFPAIPGEPIALGDIVVSIETALRQSQERGHGLIEEVAFLAVHGVLHLQGYDHMTQTDRRRMWKWQNEVMRLISMELSLDEVTGAKSAV
jgi:probable rRNA maturation factor